MQVCDDGTLVQRLCFWTLSIVLSLFKMSSCFSFKTQRFRNWILSPSSGKTQSWKWHRCPVIGTSSIDWTQLSMPVLLNRTVGFRNEMWPLRLPPEAVPQLRCWLLTLGPHFQSQVTSCEFCQGWSIGWSFFAFPLLIIIPPLFNNHLSLSPDKYDSLDQAVHYHIFSLQVGGLHVWLALAWSHSKKDFIQV
jgi:hypothetical protein